MEKKCSGCFTWQFDCSGQSFNHFPRCGLIWTSLFWGHFCCLSTMRGQKLGYSLARDHLNSHSNCKIHAIVLWVIQSVWDMIVIQSVKWKSVVGGAKPSPNADFYLAPWMTSYYSWWFMSQNDCVMNLSRWRSFQNLFTFLSQYKHL